MLCLSVTAVYFYSYRKKSATETEPNENELSAQSLAKIAPPLTLLAVLLYAWQLFINVFSAQLNFTQLNLSAGLAITLIGFVYLLTAVYYQFTAKQNRHPRLWVISVICTTVTRFVVLLIAVMALTTVTQFRTQ